MLGYEVWRGNEKVAERFVGTPGEDLERIANMAALYGPTIRIYVKEDEAAVYPYSLADLFDVHYLGFKPALIVRPDGSVVMVNVTSEVGE